MSDKSRPVRHRDLLNAQRSRLLIVDLQERLVPAIQNHKKLIQRCETLLEAAQILDVPVSATEQYPKGLGPTIEPLRKFLREIPEKLRFSSVEALEWAQPVAEREGRDQVVVAGIEAHVCVLQTAFDLAANGFNIYVPVDAVGSRFARDRKTALARMESAGITLVTVESVLFEWCEVAGTAQFKQISKLITGK